MKSFLLLLIIALSFANGFSQQNIGIDFEKFYSGEQGFKEAKKMIKEGDSHFIDNVKTSYRSALEDYQKANEYNSNYAPLNYKIGVCYLKLLYKSFSLPYLEKAYKLDKNVSPDILYQLGKAYHYNYQFEKAIECFSNYRKTLAASQSDELKKTTIAMNECFNGKELIKKPIHCYIENMSNHINSHFSEYSPLISADEKTMLFTSRRPDTKGSATDPEDNQYFEDIYESHRNNDGWSVANNVGKTLNSKIHDATVSLSPDGQRLILFRSDEEGDLFESTFDGSTWSVPQRLPSNINSAEKECSASYSSDGNTLYFTSYRKDLDSKGGCDIFVCKRNQDGQWSEAHNIGNTVNTAYDEVGVYLMPDDKTLYFSSNNSSSMGGFDIFRTSLQSNGTWSKPENIGFPINTPDDDMFYQLTANGKHAYYSSVRNDSYGDQDIYRITYLDATPSEDPKNLTASIGTNDPLATEKSNSRTSVNVSLVTGIAKDASTKQALGLKIDVYDKETNTKIQTTTSNSITGRYIVLLPAGKNYKLIFSNKSYLDQSVNFEYKKNMFYQEVEQNVNMAKLPD